jgi:hypothetical protein
LTANGCPAIVTVPDRAAPEFAATISVIVPLPVPSPEPLTLIHGESLVAVQTQLAEAVTATVTLWPVAPAASDEGAIANVHPVPAFWDTTTVRPPTSTVPVRAGPVFVVVRKVMSEVPVPFAGADTTIQEARDTAVQAQEAAVVTVMLTLPPAAPLVTAAGATA